MPGLPGTIVSTNSGPSASRGRSSQYTSAGSGFTLIELLIVVAILSILIAALAPTLARAKGQTLRVLCAANLRQIDVGVRMYLNQYNDVYPCAQDPMSVQPLYWLWMGRGWRAAVAPYFSDAVNKDNPSILFCPADPADKDRYEATSYAYSMSFYHSPAQIDSLGTVADTYSNPLPSIGQRTCDVGRPSGKILIGEWTSNHEPVSSDKGWWCWLGERRYLFADGSVCCLPATEIRPARDGLPDPNLTCGGVAGTDFPK